MVGSCLTNLSLDRTGLGFRHIGMATLLGFLLIRLDQVFKLLMGINRLL